MLLHAALDKLATLPEECRLTVEKRKAENGQFVFSVDFKELNK